LGAGFRYFGYFELPREYSAACPIPKPNYRNPALPVSPWSGGVASLQVPCCTTGSSMAEVEAASNGLNL
jgi:hypothetical protein